MSTDFATERYGSDADIVWAQAERARHALAVTQHARVMEEQAQIARLAAQARNRAAAQPVYATPSPDLDASRARVIWTIQPGD